MSTTLCIHEIPSWVLNQYELTYRPPMSLSAMHDIEEQEKEEPIQVSEFMVPLWDLEVADRLMRPAVPVGIKLRKEGDCFFAENDALAIYASGATQEEAIKDFRQTAAFFVQEFRSLSADQVTGRGARLREQFRQVFP